MPDVIPSDLPARLTEKIAVDAGGCWNWTGCTQPNGYGKSYHERRTWLAHRLTYTLLVGVIPDGLVIDHLCKNTHCVNPLHLEVVTSQVNTLRGQSPSAQQVHRTHCPLGHPLSGDNLYVHRNKRGCKRCRRDQCRASWRRRHGWSTGSEGINHAR